MRRRTRLMCHCEEQSDVAIRFSFHKGKYGFPRQCAHWLGMTGAKRRGDVGIVPYGMTENGADRVVRPYKRTVKERR